MKHVILGNGPAGVIAAETIRQRAPQDEIVMIGSENAPPYSRMAIPYLLMGNIDESGTYLRKSPNHFEKLKIGDGVTNWSALDYFASGSAVAGVVSTNPAYLMNGGLVGENIVSLALVGRVPCKVRGKIKKGDMLVSGGNGYARPDNSPQLGAVIGKALEDFDGVDGIIEVVVGRV